MFYFGKARLQWEQGDSLSFPAVDGTCILFVVKLVWLDKEEK